MILYVYDYCVGLNSYNKINIQIDGLDDFIKEGKFKVLTPREISNIEGKDVTELNKDFIKLFETELLCAARSLCGWNAFHNKDNFVLGDFVFLFSPNDELVAHISCLFPNNQIKIWLYKNEAIRNLDKLLTIKPIP